MLLTELLCSSRHYRDTGLGAGPTLEATIEVHKYLKEFLENAGRKGYTIISHSLAILPCQSFHGNREYNAVITIVYDDGQPYKDAGNKSDGLSI